MRYRPHEYQKYAVRFILEHPASAVILDMGLGKTSITLTAVEKLIYEQYEVGKVLVVAPLRVARTTWSGEIEKWDHLSDLRYSVATGTATERRAALRRDADIYIINRENIPWLIEKSGMPFDYDMVVVDELSSFKNWQAKRFRALMKVRPKVRRIVGLTGTPSSNGLMDLFAEYRLLDMGERLGRFIGQYRAQYFVPEVMNGPIVYSYRPRPGAEEQIYNRISDITISMKAVDHLDMPELVSSRWPVFMDGKEKELYEAMKKEMVLSYTDGEVTAENAASLSGKLSQMANGCVYDSDGGTRRIHDRKLDALEDIIEAANGEPVMVAYWYRHDFERIRERLDKVGIRSEKLDTEGSIRRWNRKEVPVGLIHPASAGHGLNLQDGGSFLVWFGIPWSLELYQQTNARLWRQGQRSKTVVIQHIVTEGTIDERILKALSEKDGTQEALIEAVKAEVGR